MTKTDPYTLYPYLSGVLPYLAHWNLPDSASSKSTASNSPPRLLVLAKEEEEGKHRQLEEDRK